MATLYGILNGELTNSKTCNRKAVLDAIEADGFAYGVTDSRGHLLVVNRSLFLADKWLGDRIEFLKQQNRWRAERGLPRYETEGYTVVKVYAGKRAAEAACQPAETAESVKAQLDVLLATFAGRATEAQVAELRVLWQRWIALGGYASSDDAYEAYANG